MKVMREQCLGNSANYLCKFARKREKLLTYIKDGEAKYIREKLFRREKDI
jgi:hypothetical protein